MCHPVTYPRPGYGLYFPGHIKDMEYEIYSILTMKSKTNLEVRDAAPSEFQFLRFSVSRPPIPPEAAGRVKPTPAADLARRSRTPPLPTFSRRTKASARRQIITSARRLGEGGGEWYYKALRRKPARRATGA